MWLAVLLVAKAAGAEVSPEAGTAPAASPEVVLPVDTQHGAVESGPWHLLTRLEASTLALLTPGGAGAGSGYARLTPALVVDGGEEWGLHVGASVLVRLWGGVAGAERVRREDWDSLSDWGQWVRALKLGSDASPVGLWAGALEDYSLGSGHLVRRYSNRVNPDYHPAGAFLTSTRGPLSVEAFASDVLGARLVGAEAVIDLAHVLSGPPREPGRYTLGVSVVHDWGKAGGQAPPVTLAHVDGTAVLAVLPGAELHVLGGLGGKPGVEGAWGAVAGVGADVVRPTLDMKLRLEARRQRGGFRQGYFGPDYELARLRAVGISGLPVASAPFPAGYSAYGEAVVGWDEVWLAGVLQRHLYLSVGAEVFDWGRVDVEGRLAVQLAHRRLEVSVSGLALGLGQSGTRHLYSGQLRWRFVGTWYVLAQGGTRLYPRAGGALRPMAFAELGLGVDHVR